ncbi:MAG: chemotaxis protein CheW [Treponema sp.]|nr:chemotaxis protein CheW [Treponema sp.]
MRCFSFLVNKEYFAVDVDLVQKVTRKMIVTPVPTAPGEIIGIANLKGRVITIISLYQLLGHKERRNREYDSREVKAVVFKTLAGSEDQLGLFIDKPGNLIDLDDNKIRPLCMTTGTEDNFCISGITEHENRLYRIINIESIINKYRNNGEKPALYAEKANLNEGIENV